MVVRDRARARGIIVVTVDSVQEEVRAARLAGLCIVSTSEDGSKKPIGDRARWGHYRQTRPTEEEYRSWGCAANCSGQTPWRDD